MTNQFELGYRQAIKDVRKVIKKSARENKINVQISHYPVCWQSRIDEDDWLLKHISKMLRARKTKKGKK